GTNWRAAMSRRGLFRRTTSRTKVFAPQSPISSSASAQAWRRTNSGSKRARRSARRNSGGLEVVGAAFRRDPGAGAALRFGDFARGHFFRDVGAACLRFAVAAKGRQIEPLVRFYQVAGDAVAAGRKSHAKAEAGGDVPFGRGRQMLGNEQ